MRTKSTSKRKKRKRFTMLNAEGVFWRGPWRGHALDETPDDYLRHLLSFIDLDDQEIHWLAEELRRSKGELT